MSVFTIEDSSLSSSSSSDDSSSFIEFSAIRLSESDTFPIVNLTRQLEELRVCDTPLGSQEMDLPRVSEALPLSEQLEVGKVSEVSPSHQLMSAAKESNTAGELVNATSGITETQLGSAMSEDTKDTKSVNQGDSVNSDPMELETPLTARSMGKSTNADPYAESYINVWREQQFEILSARKTLLVYKHAMEELMEELEFCQLEKEKEIERVKFSHEVLAEEITYHHDMEVAWLQMEHQKQLTEARIQALHGDNESSNGTSSWCGTNGTTAAEAIQDHKEFRDHVLPFIANAFTIFQVGIDFIMDDRKKRIMANSLQIDQENATVAEKLKTIAKVTKEYVETYQDMQTLAERAEFELSLPDYKKIHCLANRSVVDFIQNKKERHWIRRWLAASKEQEDKLAGAETENEDPQEHTTINFSPEKAVFATPNTTRPESRLSFESVPEYSSQQFTLPRSTPEPNSIYRKEKNRLKGSKNIEFIPIGYNLDTQSPVELRSKSLKSVRFLTANLLLSPTEPETESEIEEDTLSDNINIPRAAPSTPLERTPCRVAGRRLL